MEIEIKKIQNILSNPQKAKKTQNDLEMKMMTLEIQIEKNFQKIENIKQKKNLIHNTGNLLEKSINYIVEEKTENLLKKKNFRILENLKFFYENKKKLDLLKTMSKSKINRVF